MTSPADTVKSYLAALRNEDFGEAAKFCQPYWLSITARQGKIPADVLEDHLAPFRLTDFSIGEPEEVSIEKFSDVMVDIPVEVTFKNNLNSFTETRVARVICENEEYCFPTTDGKWGVNPVSFLRKGTN